jgi:hypothetical protein
MPLPPGEIVAVCAGAGGALRRTHPALPKEGSHYDLPIAPQRLDCVAGVVGLEPAKPSERYLIGTAGQLRLS